MDPLLHQFAPIRSRWCADAASGANAGLTLTRMETSQDNDTIWIFELTSSKGTHVSSIGREEGACKCEWCLLFAAI